MKKNIIWLVILTIIITACTLPVRYTDVRGSGHVQTETRAISEIRKVEFTIPGKLNITQGEEEGLEISTDDNILPYIDTSKRGDTLVIQYEEWVNVHPAHVISCTLNIKDLNKISNSSSGEINIDDLDTNRLEINISSSGNISIQKLQATSLEVNISSSGSFTASGEVEGQRVTLSSSGDALEDDLQSQIADVRISSSGSARVWVTQSLNANINSSGNVEYFGNPQVTSKISSSGKVVPLGEH